MPKDRGAEQGDVDCTPGVQPGSGHGGSGLRAGGGHPSLDWRQRSCRGTEQRLQANHTVRLQESANFQLGGPEKLTGAHDPRHALQKNGGLAAQWCMGDGAIMPFLQDFGVANARVGAERNPLKTDVIYYVNDLDAGAGSWRRPELGQNLCSH